MNKLYSLGKRSEVASHQMNFEDSPGYLPNFCYFPHWVTQRHPHKMHFVKERWLHEWE